MHHFAVVCKSTGVKVESVKTVKVPGDFALNSIKARGGDSSQNKAMVEPIPHLEEKFGAYVVAHPAGQPEMRVEVQVDVVAYKETGLQCKLNRNFTAKTGKPQVPPKVVVTADSGAQVDCINKNMLRKLGLSVENLIATSVKLGCANGTAANVMGTFFAKVMGVSPKGKRICVRTLVYVLRHGGSLLSRTTMEKFGILPVGFPCIGDQDDGQRVAGGQQVQDEVLRLEAILRSGAVDGSNIGAVRQPAGQCDPLFLRMGRFILDNNFLIFKSINQIEDLCKYAVYHVEELDELYNTEAFNSF